MWVTVRLHHDKTNLTLECNFEIVTFNITITNILYQTVCKFVNQFCSGYNITIVDKYSLFKEI